MPRLIHTVLVGALVLVAAFGRAEARESLELQPQPRPSNDQPQPDSHEKFKAASAELHDKAVEAHIAATAGVNRTAGASEEPDDASSETTGSIELGKRPAMAAVNETATVDAAAAQAANDTASSDEVDTATTQVTIAANRDPIGSRLLQHRLTRLGATTTVRNVVTAPKDSDEESDSTVGRARPVTSDGGGQGRQTNWRKRVFGGIRTTTTSTTTTTTEGSEEIKGDAVATTTARSSTTGNRFARVRTTVPSSAGDSSERQDSVSTARPTTARSSVSVNRFSRLRATTTTAATAGLRDSGESFESVTPAPSTTTPRGLPRNRFRGTATSKPVARDSDEQADTTTTAATTTTDRGSVAGNRFGRLRTTSTVRSTGTANSDEEDAEATPTTTRRPANRFGGRVRSTTTVRATTASKDSDETADSVDATTTTARSPARVNRFRSSGLRPTTTSAPTGTAVSKGSDEQGDPISGNSQSTTVRHSLLRNKFVRTKPARVSATTAKDSSEREDSNGTRKWNSTSESSRAHVTTISALTSSDSGEEEKLMNGTLAAAERRGDSDEKIDSAKASQPATTARSSIFLKYFNRYRTTKASKPSSDRSDEVERVGGANETSPTPRQHFLNRLRSAAASIAPVTNLTAPAAPSSETSNLGRKDRAIIYSSAKSDNQLITSSVSTAQVETPPTTPTPTPTTNKGYYAFGGSDEMDDTSEDDDASRAPYFDPYYGVAPRESSAGVPSAMEENSLEVDDVSSESESNGSVTAKPDDNSSEVTAADMVPTKVSDARHVFLHPDARGDVSVEVVFQVPDHPYQPDARNETATAQNGAGFAESDEGNEGSLEEREGSGDVAEESKNSTTSIQHGDAHPVRDSGEGNEASMENKGTNGEAPDGDPGGSNATAKVDGVSRNSDENDDNSSLEIDLSKLTDIQRILTDVKTEEAVPPEPAAAEAPTFFADALRPVELISEEGRNPTTTTAPVPETSARSQDDSRTRHAVSSDEVTMKLKELLANPVVQQRLEAIDGRLKSTKSARVKRLIEKYLAALAKLSTSGASASASLSVFLPLLMACFLFGFS